MTHRLISICVLLLGVAAMGLTGIAQQSATEAPAGFDTPTLAQNAGRKVKITELSSHPVTLMP